MVSGFWMGFGFFWGLCSGLGVIAAILLIFAVIIGGLADRYQRD
jgi:hypothetical protein